MPYDYMIERLDLSLSDRLDYYSSDLESACEALDDLRTEDHIERDTDSKLRMVILALSSISQSLVNEANGIRNKGR